MLKFFVKLFFVFISFFCFFSFVEAKVEVIWWSCNYSNSMPSVWTFLNNCKPKTLAWSQKDDYQISESWWLKRTINRWIKNAMLVLWVCAVWALVYAGLLLQFSGWESEKVKWAKQIVIWTLLWLLMMMFSSWIVYLVVNFIFSLWS